MRMTSMSPKNPKTTFLGDLKRIWHLAKTSRELKNCLLGPRLKTKKEAPSGIHKKAWFFRKKKTRGVNFHPEQDQGGQLLEKCGTGKAKK